MCEDQSNKRQQWGIFQLGANFQCEIQMLCVCVGVFLFFFVLKVTQQSNLINI